MLAKRYRFHSRGGVNYTYNHGRTIRTPTMTLIFNANSRGKQRFCVVVSKKVAKSAVLRNRIRRRVYEQIRLYKWDKRYNLPVDHIFIVYTKDMLTMPATEIYRAIASLIAQSMI